MKSDDKNPDKKKVDALKEWFKKNVEPDAFDKIDIKLTADSRTVIAKKNFIEREAVIKVNFDKGAIDTRYIGKRCSVNKALEDEKNILIKNELLALLKEGKLYY